MSTVTRNRARNGAAPAQEPAPATAAPVPSLDLLALAEQETPKAKRQYREISDRAPMGDGRLAVVAQEMRADGTLGDPLVGIVRVNAKEPVGSDRRESVSYSSARDLKLVAAALATVGVKFLTADA